MTDLTGCSVRDGDGRIYRVTRHVIEADELVLERGDETHPITMMDIAEGPFEVVSE